MVIRGIQSCPLLGSQYTWLYILLAFKKKILKALFDVHECFAHMHVCYVYIVHT